MLTAHPVGPQFLVSPTLALGDHSAPVAVIDSTGDFVTAWRNLEANGSYSIDAEVVHADGTAASSVFQVTTGMLGNQLNPAIASDGNGAFIITWQGENLDQGGYDIYYKSESVTFDGGGAATVSGNDQNAVLVSPADVAGTLNTINPSAAMDSSGNFVIAWQSQDASQPQNGSDIHARLGAIAGGLQAQDFLVNSTINGDQTSPTVAMAQTANSSFVIAWQGPSTATALAAAEEGGGETGEESGLGIFAKVYSSGGAVNSTEFEVDSGSNHDQVAPAVAMNANGQAVVAWQAEGNQGTGSDIFAREFTASLAGGVVNVTLGSQFEVNTTTQQPQRAPAVGIDQNGNFLVSWQSSHQDGYSWGVYGRYYQAGASSNSATAATDEFLVNDQIQQGPQIAPAISVLPSGQAAITWLGPQVNQSGTEGQGGHPPGVHAKTLNINNLPTEITAGTVPSEFLVSLYTAPEDHAPAAAMDAQGNSVVVWQSWEDSGDMSGYGVFAQRYLADGTPIGGPILVNVGTDPALTNGNQDSPSVAMDAAGDFVVVWHSQGLDGVQSSIIGRYFDASTQQWSDPFQVTPYLDNMPQKPAVSMDSNGNFVVVWQSNNQEQVVSGSASATANTFGIFGQRFSKGGSPEGASFQVNTFTDTNQVSPTVSMNAQGQFVVAWVSDHNVADNADDTEKSIFARWYDANGQAPNPEFLANDYVKDAQESPSVAIGPNGDFVIVWQSINQEKNQLGAGSSWGVYARQFHPDGSSPQKEFLVNQTTEGPQRYASVGMSGQGNFTVAWQTMNQDGSSWAVMQRQFAANGSPMTNETQVNTWTSGPQILPAVAENARGNYDIFWAGQGTGSAGTPVDGIQGRLNAIPPAVLAIHGPTAINLMNTGLSGAYTLQLSATGDGAGAVTSWTINWGDGEIQTITGNPSSVNHEYKAIHQTYVITATADDASGSHAAGNTVSVTFDFNNQNQRFVAALYQEFLHRDADPQGLSYHVNQLDSGASRASVALVFEDSREYSTSFVTGLYQSLLHRTASQSEIDFWVGQLIGGATWEQVEAAFLGSAEYFAKHGSANAAFLNAVYEDVLGRSLDSAGQTFWEAMLASGMSRQTVAAKILDSLETDQLVVDNWYQTYLHRPADESVGLPFWSGMLHTGTPDETVLAGILGSQEYYNLQ